MAFFALANDCNEQYEAASDTLCIRVSSYPETYEDAQARCNLEGGQLLQDINPSVHVRHTLLYYGFICSQFHQHFTYKFFSFSLVTCT